MKHLQRYRWGITVVLVLLVGGGGYLLWKPTLPSQPPPAAAIVIVSTPTPLPTATAVPTPTPPPVVVYVSGAVLQPGVYELPAGARVADALAAAGGATTEASLAQINLARRVRDEEQIHIPREGEPTLALPTPVSEQAAADPAAQGDTPGKININTAGVAELDSLPGIGPGYAQRIIDYRESNGPFSSIEEIQNVPGIGPSTFARIRELITVGS